MIEEQYISVLQRISQKCINEHNNLSLLLVYLCQNTVQLSSDKDKVDLTMASDRNWVWRILDVEELFGVLYILPNRVQRLSLLSGCTQLY